MAESSPADTLADWLAHLETLHPKSIDLGLDRIRAVAQALSVLPAKSRTITVAGTNGKGSCVAALQALLLKSGCSVGVYTSPHLISFNERIAINGKPASDQQILAAFEAIEAARGPISLSYFEFATLAALWLFRRSDVEWQILEVGLGGRLDAVNIVDADACVITSIGIDHTEWLGDTRELIAPEKAGVARAGCPAVVAETDLPATLIPTLETIGADIWLRDQRWVYVDGQLRFEGITRSMPEVNGLQSGNLAAAVVALAAINAAPSDDVIQEAFSALSVPGRQQRVSLGDCDWWFDVSHNQESVLVLAQTLAKNPTEGRVHAIFGAMADKPLRGMLEAMAGQVDEWHLPATPDMTRAAEPSALLQLLVDVPATGYESAEAALSRVQQLLEPGDRVIVFGSFVVVGAQMSLLADKHPGLRLVHA